MAGHAHINGTSTGLEHTISLRYDAVDLAVTDSFFNSSRRWKVVDIRGAVDTLGTGGACTGQIFKAPSGTVISGGTVLHSGSFNLVGTINTNQTLTLSATASDLEIAVGDRIGFVLTGTPTTAKGSITVTLVPVVGP